MKLSDILGDDEEEEEEEDEDEPENDDDLEQFLDANSQPEPLPEPVPVAPVVVPPLDITPAEPAAPAFDSSWQIEIFAGDIKRVEEVQIPESEWPVIEPKETEEAGESEANPLLKGLKTLFGSGEKQNKDATDNQETEQPESLPAVNDDQNVEDSIPVPAELLDVN